MNLLVAFFALASKITDLFIMKKRDDKLERIQLEIEKATKSKDVKRLKELEVALNEYPFNPKRHKRK